MRCLERFCDLLRNQQCLFKRHRSAHDAIGECFAFHEFENEESGTISFLKIVDCGDVGVIQSCQNFCLALEAAGPIVVAAELVGKNFDSNVAFQLWIFAAIHLAHFDTGATITRWDMPRLMYHWSTPCWRYTLSEWVALIVGAGFTINGLHEPRPTAEQVKTTPDLDDCSRVPFFLIFDMRKPMS